jgi:hypothetical protein
MNSMAGVLLRIPLFKVYRQFGWPPMLPLNQTLSPSPKCNSRCLTCNIWMKREDELTLEEWDKVSVFNVGQLEEIIAYADRSGADQFITEIAEPRVELDTVGLPITPSAEDYAKAGDRLIAYVERKRFKGQGFHRRRRGSASAELLRCGARAALVGFTIRTRLHSCRCQTVPEAVPAAASTGLS